MLLYRAILLCACMTALGIAAAASSSVVIADGAAAGSEAPAVTTTPVNALHFFSAQPIGQAAGAPPSTLPTTSSGQAPTGEGAQVVLLAASQATTAVCMDWSTSGVTTQASACASHGGILDWFGPPASRAADAAASSGGLLDHAAGVSAALLPPGEPISVQGPAALSPADGGSSGAAPERVTAIPPAPAGAADPDIQPFPGAPPTAVCQDGSLSYNSNQSQACGEHGGLSQWLGSS